jgi:oxygen-independent coproporphyrinogen-3 oxidase
MGDRVQMYRKAPKAYLDNIRNDNAMQEKTQVEANKTPLAFMMCALRLANGFHPSLLEARSGQPLSAIESKLRAGDADGLLVVGPEDIAPTAKGRRCLDVRLERFL